jgi:hypothetical protein
MFEILQQFSCKHFLFVFLISFMLVIVISRNVQLVLFVKQRRVQTVYNALLVTSCFTEAKPSECCELTLHNSQISKYEIEI